MRIAVAGLGFMGATHIRALKNVPGAELEAVFSGDDTKLSGDLSGAGGNLGAVGDQFDFRAVRKYRELANFLEDPLIEAVDLCLPTDQHFGAAMAALEAGKHVLVEKPLALESAQAEQLVEAARKRERILMTGHVVRFIPEYAALREIVRSGRYGPVRAAFFRRRCAAPSWSQWLTNPAQSGGAVVDLLIHDFDFCMQLFGTPEKLSAVGSQVPESGIDWLESRIAFEGCGPVVVTGGWHHPRSYPFSMEFTVLADGGTLEYRLGEPLRLYDANGLAEDLPLAQQDPFVAELAYFTECVRKGEWPEQCPPEESAAAVKLARCMLASRARGGEEIAWR